MQKLYSYWQGARKSLWLLPSILVLFATVFSFILLQLDRNLALTPENRFWLFNGSPSAARSLLSTIAAAVITVVSIAFSLTIIAIQQASTQYTPRVLRTFTSDLGNQLVLGTYLATFVYSLLVLRAIRGPGEDGDGFVPFLSATVAILLVLICIALLIYFINHMAKSLQALTIITRVHSDLLKQLKEIFPDEIGTGRQKRRMVNKKISWITYPVEAPREGFISLIDESRLREIDSPVVKVIEITSAIGSFVAKGDTVAYVSAENKNGAEGLKGSIKKSIIISHQRSPSQDPLFPIRQLVDIAIKALSPGINDQTTAEYCIRYLGNALTFLADRKFPPLIVNGRNKKTVIKLSKPDWEDFVFSSFLQIRSAASSKPDVLNELIRTIQRLSSHIPTAKRAKPLKQVLEEIEYVIKNQSFPPLTREELTKALRETSLSLSRVE